MKAHAVVGGGGGGSKCLLCDPESQLQKGGSWRIRAKKIDGMETKNDTNGATCCRCLVRFTNNRYHVTAPHLVVAGNALALRTCALRSALRKDLQKAGEGCVLCVKLGGRGTLLLVSRRDMFFC